MWRVARHQESYLPNRERLCERLLLPALSVSRPPGFRRGRQPLTMTCPHTHRIQGPLREGVARIFSQVCDLTPQRFAL
jgi:hypothetical protein